MITLRLLMPLLLVSVSLTVPPPPQKTQSFWSRVVKFFGVSASPGNQRGDDSEVKDGDIYIYNVTSRIGSAVKQGTFRSPIFLPGDKAILALSGDKVVKIDVENGTSEELFTIPGIKKLVGVDQEAPDQVLILSDVDNDSCPSVGILALTDGKVTSLTHGGGSEDRDLVSHLRNWDREYDGGNTKLEIRLVTKKRNNVELKATDAFLKRKEKDWVNVSRCEAGVNCGQPSISNDRKFVLFIGKV